MTVISNGRSLDVPAQQFEHLGRERDAHIGARSGHHSTGARPVRSRTTRTGTRSRIAVVCKGITAFFADAGLRVRSTCSSMSLTSSTSHRQIRCGAEH